MKACVFASVVAVALSIPFSARAQNGPVGPSTPYPVTKGKAYQFEKVADGVYYATGGVGGNHAVIVNEHDVVLVDSGTTPATARDLLQDIKLLTPNPVRYVINTHFHYDHTDGNQIFGPEVQIIGTEYVRNAILTFDVLHREPFITSQVTAIPALIDSLQKQIAAEKDAAKKADLQKQLADTRKLAVDIKEIKPTPPNVTYTNKMMLFRGGREIDLLFLGRGHTGGDTVVFLPKEKIVCTGDLVESRIAYMGDAYFGEWVNTLDALKKLDFDVVLPGHGTPFVNKSLITAFQNYLTDLMAQAAALKKKGVSADDAAKRVDLTAHQKDFPQITGPGADLRGMRRLYAWMDEEGKK